MLSITELETPIPACSRLWLAKTPAEWFYIMQETGLFAKSEHLPPPLPRPGRSLKDLFQDLLHNNLEDKSQQPSAVELKLLLHPIQSLLCHLGPVVSCYSERTGSYRAPRPLTTVSTLLRLEEVDSTLQRWYNLCMINAREDPTCAVTGASLVLYHLVSLNAITCFPEIERLGRKEGFSEYAPDWSSLSTRCIQKPERAIIHCGQILRLISLMHKCARPPWWAAAIYRATMILWANSVLHAASNPRVLTSGTPFEINLVPPEDLAISEYLRSGSGTPILVGLNGESIDLCSSQEILRICIGFLDGGLSLRFSDGVGRKLQGLARNWRTK